MYVCVQRPLGQRLEIWSSYSSSQMLMVLKREGGKSRCGLIQSDLLSLIRLWTTSAVKWELHNDGKKNHNITLIPFVVVSKHRPQINTRLQQVDHRQHTSGSVSLYGLFSPLLV